MEKNAIAYYGTNLILHFFQMQIEQIDLILHFFQMQIDFVRFGM